MSREKSKSVPQIEVVISLRKTLNKQIRSVYYRENVIYELYCLYVCRKEMLSTTRKVLDDWKECCSSGKCFKQIKCWKQLWHKK
jgi:DNA-binding XRE family transcriptional regulator